MIQKREFNRNCSKYIEIINQIKKLEEEKEKLREKLINSEKEKIGTRNGIIKILTKKNAILDNDKIIFTLSKQELTKVATISISKFRKFAENKFNIDDFIVDYKITKEVKVMPLDKQNGSKQKVEDITGYNRYNRNIITKRLETKRLGYKKDCLKITKIF
jgi:hypothetical protein